MATAADVDLRGWTRQNASPIWDGGFPTSARTFAFDIAFGANRTSGVAPFAVQFVAGFDESSGTDRDFHDLHYSWNFGETTGETWIGSGKSKDSDTSPIVAHVYDTPGTYTTTLSVRNSTTGALVRSESVEITVTDPDTVFSGTNTVVINNVGDSDFSGKPAGATEVNSDDLVTDLPSYLGSGKRVLLKRGGSWNVASTITVPSTTVTCHVGAYGTGTSPDDQGLFSNAPTINTVGSAVAFLDVNETTDVRITDLMVQGDDLSSGINNGGRDNREVLIYNNKMDNHYNACGWDFFANDANDLITDNFIINNRITNTVEYSIYVVGEHTSVVGNYCDGSDTTHVTRHLWNYVGCISHNMCRNSSLNNANGRHAFKIHGAKETTEIGDYATIGGKYVRNRTKFLVVSNNIAGSSGTWPIAIGPQDAAADERLSDILVENNRVIDDYTSSRSPAVTTGIRLWADQSTIRNNLLTVQNNTGELAGIFVGTRGVEPNHSYVYVHHNTIYGNGDPTNSAVAIDIGTGTTNSEVINNICSFPDATDDLLLNVRDSGTGNTVSSNSALTDAVAFTDPDNVTPLSRDFTLQAGSTAIASGTSVPVYDDITGAVRSNDDLGAYKY